MPACAARSPTAAFVALTLSACSLVPGAPAMPADGAQPDARPPALRASLYYETAVATVDVAAPLVAFSRWFERTGAPALRLAGAGLTVMRTEPLAGGGWRAPGDRRRLDFADGTVATEQLLFASLGARRVEFWGLTSGIGRYIAYAVEDVVVETTSGTRAPSTRVTWTIAFEPVFQPPDGWVIRSWVRNDVRAAMQAGLDALAARAVRDLLPAVDTKPEGRP